MKIWQIVRERRHLSGLLEGCRLLFGTYNYAIQIHKEAEHLKASRFYDYSYSYPSHGHYRM